jgi:hypothetical protein
MLYRASTILAILGYIAAQIAATPHAHSGVHQHHGHDSQPHVHLSGHDAAHSHHGHGHAHHHHHDSQSHDSSDDAATVIAAEGHDSDAVYLPSEIQITSRGEGVRGIQSTWLLCHASPAFITFAYPDCVSASLASINQAAGTSARHCALYLSLRILRI